MDKQNKVTISICVTPEIAEQLEMFANEFSVSKSSVATAMLSMVCNWAVIHKENIVREGLKHGKES